MAANYLDSSDIKKQEQLEDITTCCICTEVYTDPKALPCIHTFCMKCLRETGLQANKGPGDEMPCPICRRLFKIPSEGFSGLPKHFFIERLIQCHVSKVSDPSEVAKALCSVCLEESEEDKRTETPTADTYCIDCKKKLCEECCSEHKKFKLTKNHKLISITEYESGQNVIADRAPSVCELHEQNILNVYCADCKTVVCAICFIEEHNNHKGSHVNKCLVGFRQQIQDNTETINGCISRAQMKKAEIMKVKEEMQRVMESLECNVGKRKDEIKQFIDKHASRLLQSLCSERQSRLKEIQMATDDTDAYLLNLESYNSYCQRLMAEGSASDICRAISDLSFRASELEQQCQPTIERSIQVFKFRFRPSEPEELLEEDRGNLVGEIEEEDDSKPKKRRKESLLEEQSMEIDSLRKEIEIERTEKESFRLTNEQFRINVANEVQVNKTLTDELSNVEANYNTHIARLKQELDNSKIANYALQTDNNKLKQDLHAEKMTNKSLQTTNYRLVEDLDMYRATVETLETNAEKLREEQWTTKTVEIRYKSDPVLVQTIRIEAAEKGKKSIRGLTILDKALFVAHEKSSEVEVYDTTKFSFIRRWNLKELIDPRDIGSCKRNNCIYIFNIKDILSQSREMLRVDPNGKLLKTWSTGYDYGWGLSVTDESNVILAVCNKNKLNEYSPDGQLIREINLSTFAGIHHPWHAIKLINGHFMVCHGISGYDLHRVCTVDADGKLKKSFGGKCGATIGQINSPGYLSVDGNGFVMVADWENRRVLLLDAELELRRDILSKEKHGILHPTRILLDESNGRLFVANNESNNQRILIFDCK